MNMTITTAPSSGTGPADQLPDTFDLDELKGTFTDAEIKAMSEGDDPIVVLPDPDKKSEPDSETLNDQDAEALAAAQLAQQQAAEVPAAKQPAEIPDDDRAPMVEVPDTAAAQAILDAADAKIDEIQQKYDDGELSKADMQAQIKALVGEQAKAQATIASAEQVISDASATAQERWTSQINKFLAAGNEALVTPEHYAGFDQTLKVVTSDPANAGLSYSQMIQLAATRYGIAYAARTGKALQIKTPGQTTTDPAPKPQQEKRPDAPQLLSNLNGDGGLSVDDGSFSAIDRAGAENPFAMERMMAGLSDAAMDAYLRGQ